MTKENECSCKKGYTCVMCTMELMDEDEHCSNSNCCGGAEE
jgi:hypothetical protein